MSNNIPPANSETKIIRETPPKSKPFISYEHKADFKVTEKEKKVEKALGYSLPDGSKMIANNDGSIVATALRYGGKQLIFRIEEDGKIYFTKICGSGCRNVNNVLEPSILSPEKVTAARRIILQTNKQEKRKKIKLARRTYSSQGQKAKKVIKDLEALLQEAKKPPIDPYYNPWEGRPWTNLITADNRFKIVKDGILLLWKEAQVAKSKGEAEKKIPQVEKELAKIQFEREITRAKYIIVGGTDQQFAQYDKQNALDNIRTLGEALIDPSVIEDQIAQINDLAIQAKQVGLSEEYTKSIHQELKRKLYQITLKELELAVLTGDHKQVEREIQDLMIQANGKYFKTTDIPDIFAVLDIPYG